MYGVKPYMGSPSQARPTGSHNYETVTLVSPREGSTLPLPPRLRFEPIKIDYTVCFHWLCIERKLSSKARAVSRNHSSFTPRTLGAISVVRIRQDAAMLPCVIIISNRFQTPNYAELFIQRATYGSAVASCPTPGPFNSSQTKYNTARHIFSTMSPLPHESTILEGWHDWSIACDAIYVGCASASGHWSLSAT